MVQQNSNDFNPNPEQPKKDLSPIPFDNSDSKESEVSHTPLSLGGGSAPAPAAKPAPAPAASPKPAAAPTPAPKPTSAAPAPAVRQQASTSSAEKITGVKIFFTKLHAGAMDFLSEQITDWLKANPNVVIKQTNMTVGEVAAKKTEPNLIITVWY